MASIIFFGNERLATGVTTTTPALKALVAAGHDVKAVVANYERGTSRNSRILEIQVTANELGIPVVLPDKPITVIEQLKSYGADIAVLVAYGRIVPQAIIDIFPKGIINIHPSLLPLHRGPTPLESVLLHGDRRTGVSVMQLVQAMDAGPVFAQKEVALKGTETKQELADMLLHIGSSMIVELLPGILDDSVTAEAQDEQSATYDSLIKKEDGKIDTSKSAIALEREIRAYAGWPKSYTVLAGKDVIITKAHVSKSCETNELGIKTAEDYLIIDALKPAGKSEMSAKEFLRGYNNKL